MPRCREQVSTLGYVSVGLTVAVAVGEVVAVGGGSDGTTVGDDTGSLDGTHATQPTVTRMQMSITEYTC